MKKLMCVLAAVALVAVVSTSCKKTCECTTKAGGVVIATASSEIKKGKCSDLDSKTTVLGITQETTCK